MGTNVVTAIAHQQSHFGEICLSHINEFYSIIVAKKIQIDLGLERVTNHGFAYVMRPVETELVARPYLMLLHFSLDG